MLEVTSCKKWIDSIPGAGPFPYPVADLGKLVDIDPDEDGIYSGNYSSLGIKG